MGEEAGFRQLVRDALGHLYDLPYLQTHRLARLVQPKPRAAEAGKALREALVEAIDSLRPEGPIGTESRAWRNHRLLALRYVEAIEPDRAAEQLSISRSELFRDLRQSVDDVASLLWSRWGLAEDASEPDPTDSTPGDLARPFSLFAKLHPSNLPTPWTSLVGRRAAIQDVTGLLRKSPLVTLTGPGGCGKTRLALEVARGLLEEYEAAVWLVDLAPLAEPTLVPNLVATALGIRDQVGEPIGLVIRRQLRDRRLLLVLDNCEHLVEACARLADELLQACSGMRILATSRESLRLPGEVVWLIPPLDLPLEGERSPAALVKSEAVRLFVERAAAVRPTFAVTPANAPGVADLCRRLDGIPLALELAAARLGALSVEQVSERLSERFDLLAAGSRAAAPRQQTLRATLDWSYQLLDEAERQLFARLAVFSGTFGLQSVESVCSDESLPAGRLFAVLSQLVDKSLVVVSPESDGPVWYWLLETVREYGRELLETSGEASRLRQRHAEHYLGLVAPPRADAALTPPKETQSGGPEQIVVIDGEYANVRAALFWLEANGQPQLALKMASELWVYWTCHHAGEGLEHLTRLVRLPGESGPSLEHARATLNTGNLCIFKADLDRARGYLEESLAAFRQLGGAYGVGHSLLSLGKVARLVGHCARARAYAGEARPVLEGISDHFGLGWLAFDLGEVACDECDYETAADLAEQAARLWRGMSSNLLMNRVELLVRTAYLRGDYAAARSLLEEYHDVRLTHRSDRFAITKVWQGLLDAAEGSHGMARSRLCQALPALVRASLLLEAQLALDGLASLDSAEGHHRRAVRVSGSAEALREVIGLSLAPCWRAWRERWLEPSSQALGPDAEAAWAEGQAMTLEQAVECALRDEG